MMEKFGLLMKFSGFEIKSLNGIAAWTDYGYEVPDEEYFVYGEEQDCVTLRI